MSLLSLYLFSNETIEGNSGEIISIPAPASIEKNRLIYKSSNGLRQLVSLPFVKNDHVIANEYAPRVHNSGHWTIEGAKTSQFENHLRAILNMKLGDTSEKGFVGMENLIGTIPSDIKQLKEDFFLHDYGKTERPGRKLGHISVIGENKEEREEKLRVIQKIISN